MSTTLDFEANLFNDDKPIDGNILSPRVFNRRGGKGAEHAAFLKRQLG